MSKAEERAQVVDFLRREAAEYVDGGPFGKVVYAAMLHAADQIERGEHEGVQL